MPAGRRRDAYDGPPSAGRQAATERRAMDGEERGRKMTDTAGDTALLEVHDLYASYGPVQVLHGLSFSVKQGEVVVILGANGAGKTTTLRAICQMTHTRGSVRVAGHEVHGKTTPEVVRAGVAHVPQGRGTFPDLTVMDNLEVGAFVRKDREVKADIDRWLEVFPRLRYRRSQVARRPRRGDRGSAAGGRAVGGRPNTRVVDG